MINYTKNLNKYLEGLERAAHRVRYHIILGLKKIDKSTQSDRDLAQTILQQSNDHYLKCLDYIEFARRNIDKLNHIMSDFPIEEAMELISIGVPKAEICRKYGITFPTLQKRICLAESILASKEIEEDLKNGKGI